jgi:hypothetical protein
LNGSRIKQSAVIAVSVLLVDESDFEVLRGGVGTAKEGKLKKLIAYTDRQYCRIIALIFITHK